jgi:hypothetical protein
MISADDAVPATMAAMRVGQAESGVICAGLAVTIVKD